MSSAKLITGFVCTATFLTAPGLALAQTCTSDADCSKGLSCQVDGIAVPPVAICSPGDAGCAPVDTTATVSKSCQSASCATDADCGANMVCHRQTSTTCTGGSPVTEKCDPTTGCDPNAVPVPQPVLCTDTVTATCAYRYELPCNADADCGANFGCQPTTYGMCTGGTGTAPPASGGASSGAGGAAAPGTAAPVPPPNVLDAGAPSGVTCTTVSSYPGYCLAKTIPCTTAADCPVNWACATVSTGTATGGATGGAAGGPVAVDAGVAAPVPVAPPETTLSSVCQPPTTHGYRGAGKDTGTQGGGTISLVTDAGTATGSTTPPTPQVPGNNAGPTTEQTNAAATARGGGCNVGGLEAASAWLLGALGALGLLAARRRRS